MKNFTLLFSILLLSAFSWQANAQSQCDHTFTMIDSYGDGWNGFGSPLTSAVDIEVNGVAVATDVGLDFTAGSYQDEIFSAASGDVITLANWVAGAYDNEVSWEIKDGDGIVIASGGHGELPTTAIGACASCPAPSAGTASNITTTSADLSWTVGGAETTWDIEYGVAPFTATGTPTIAGTMTNPNNLTILTPGTTYEFYVRADCGGDQSNWAGPYSFTTIGDCASQGSYEYGNNEDSANAVGFIANTPGDYITLTFSAGSTESGYDYWFINDAADGSGATIATGDGAITGAYESTTGEISFYVESDGGVQGTTFVYGLSCSPPASCPAPSAGTVSNITTTSADLGWTVGGAETTWDIEYGVAPFTATGTPTIAGTMTNPNNLTMLTPGTTYEFYVRADCGGDQSAWVGPYSFTTYGDCASSGTYDYDNNEDFTNAVGFIANTPGDYITLTFTGGITESCCDNWFIMDAADGTGNVIASGAGSVVGTYESTTGEISFFVDSDGSFSPVGGGGTAGTTWDTFVYSLSCSPPCDLAATAVATDEMFFGANDGTATVTADLGTTPYTYLWDDALAQATPTATGLAPGMYTATVTDANGCVANATATVNAGSPPTSIVDNVENSAFAIYPNPNSGTFNVKLPKDNSTIVVRNIIGQVVFSKTVNSTIETIQLNDVNSGVYFITSGNVTKRFIVK